jgi:hypothetical protein
MHYQVSDIPVHEYFTGLCIGDLIGGNTAIAATYPKKFRCLYLAEPTEKFRVIFYFFLSPGFVFQQ